MAAGETEIANIALGHIGAPKIQDIEDRENKSAREAKRIFASSRRAIAAKHKWNCLTKRAIAAQLTVKPIFGFAEQYQLPTDYITMVELNGLDVEKITDRWKVEGLLLLSDADSANIIYVADVTNVSEWSPGFEQCVALHMAAQLATTIRQDGVKAAELESRLEDRALSDARKTDSNEANLRPIDTTSGSQYIKSRRRSTNG